MGLSILIWQESLFLLISLDLFDVFVASMINYHQSINKPRYFVYALSSIGSLFISSLRLFLFLFLCLEPKTTILDLETFSVSLFAVSHLDISISSSLYTFYRFSKFLSVSNVLVSSANK